MPKIPKKWKWTGELFISSSENKTELLCLVTIADPTGMSNSSHISLLMSAQDSIRIPRLHPIMDLSPIIRACGTPQYFGQLNSNEPGDEVLTQGLKHHMANQALAATVPLLLDDDEVAVLIVFPATQLGLAKVLEVPEYLTSGTPLLVVLLPFLVPSSKASKDVGWRHVHTVTQSLSSCKAVEMGHELLRGTILSQATFLLGFPKSLLDFLSSSSTPKTYSIWPLPAQSSGLDTALLQHILRSTKATFARLEDDVRVVFICNRNLETLHTMPSLVIKRANSPETQFWTYGYSTRVTSSRWGLQEIFPLGGIMTFTTTALAEDPVGCCQLMSQVIDHPLWHCYLIPEVLAVSHLLTNHDDHGLCSPSCLDPILDLVEAGLVCVIRMPGQGHKTSNAWLSQVLRDSTLSTHDLLGVYISALREHPTTAGMSPQQLVSFANNEVTQDLAKAQIQPVFMDKYRRFVVIRAASEETISAEENGFEWCPLASFSFGDDYFQVATA
ncbi:hypothetical protein PAXRUDRAFT_674090 [Paxillus rubicundulus Ve08.2h10]|uniref:Uncharacterized protein n=1 Tax=Paxillus rubicundulus Ve08.2h10 TaxID=930991 RepID=A0A0D0DV60_9AGAM|nr:hypothetical protein PAXRUDRAFT_674090 [Paxillus rubicundulus Ve08.2h10]